MSDRLIMALDLAGMAKSMVIDGEGHRILSDPAGTIKTPAGDKAPHQVAWFLEHDRWEDDVLHACEFKGCLTHLKLGGVEEEGQVDLTEDDPVLRMVEKTSVTLADLYRKGRAKGLLAPRHDYK